MPAENRNLPRTRRGAATLVRAAGLLAVAGASLGPTAARAQSLLELYEGAHGYDATYLSARALADSAIYRVEQVRALMRPSASLSATAGRTATKPTVGDNFGSDALSATLSGR